MRKKQQMIYISTYGLIFLQNAQFIQLLSFDMPFSTLLLIQIIEFLKPPEYQLNNVIAQFYLYQFSKKMSLLQKAFILKSLTKTTYSSQSTRHFFSSTKPNELQESQHWYPKSLNDLNLIKYKLISLDKKQLNKYAQFTDEDYMNRRKMITQIAQSYQMNQKIKDVPYSKEQTNLWTNIYKGLKNYHKNSMTQKFIIDLAKIEKIFKYNQRIPQLNELSQYLNSQTRFILKPVAGMINQRDFLNALAYRTFCCCQYIRHPSSPQYTPEPDIVHELVGHIPSFADKYVAQISQKIGKLSLGASDKVIKQLGNLYLYTIQFGSVMEYIDGKRTPRAYGAGIASSGRQIAHYMSKDAIFLPLNINQDTTSKVPLQQLQYSFRYSESYESAIELLLSYNNQIPSDLQKKILESCQFR